MLTPAAGLKGIINNVLKTVDEAGSNPSVPPVIVGVGIGGTAEKAMLLAKKALLRKVRSDFDPEAAEFSMMTFGPDSRRSSGSSGARWSSAGPERLARQAVRLEPGFVGAFSMPAFAFSVLATLVWFWMIVTSPRSPMRGIMHWMTGLTLFWLLIAALWMPWIDYGESLPPVLRITRQDAAG